MTTLLETLAKAVVLEKVICRAICRKWPRDPDGCAALCMSRLGEIPKEGCNYAIEVHGKMAREIMRSVREAKDVA